MREVPVDDVGGCERSARRSRPDIFEPGDLVKVTGTSKGKGFAGAVKRYHFHGGDMTHGSMIHRKPQSGGATDAARTFKGVKAAWTHGQQGSYPARTDRLPRGSDAEPAAYRGLRCPALTAACC